MSLCVFDVSIRSCNTLPYISYFSHHRFCAFSCSLYSLDLHFPPFFLLCCHFSIVFIDMLSHGLVDNYKLASAGARSSDHPCDFCDYSPFPVVRYVKQSSVGPGGGHFSAMRLTGEVGYTVMFDLGFARYRPGRLDHAVLALGKIGND